MKDVRFGRGGVVVVVAVVSICLALIGCKSSGVAVSSKGQVMNIDVEVPSDLSEGATEELKVSISNRGVNRIDDVIFEVEMPNELIVLSQVPSRGVRMTERLSSLGTRIYQYAAGDIDVATSSEVTFHVRAAFGSRTETGDIKVTAWSEDLPGDRLHETKRIRLRS